jgi:DNA-directed RNA polymerase alpha subunit
VDDDLYQIDLKIAGAKALIKELQAERRMLLQKKAHIVAATSAKRGVFIDIDRVKLSWTDLSLRSRNVVRFMGAETIHGLTQLTERDILREPNAGAAVVEEIKDFLLQFGLTLKGGE